MRDFSYELKEQRRRLDEAHRYLKIDDARARRDVLEREMGEPDLWDDQDRAKAVGGEYASVTDDLVDFDALVARMNDLELLHEMAREEGDEAQEPAASDTTGGAVHGLIRPVRLVASAIRRMVGPERQN